VTGILSSISGYFSKSLILGTFLPVVVFMVLGLVFLVPLLPAELPLFTLLKGLDKQWEVVAISFVAIVISGLVYNLNIPILRLYEGYPWRNSWIGIWLTRRHVSRFDAAQYRIEAMRTVLRDMIAAGKDLSQRGNFVREVIAYWQALGAPLRGPGFKEHEWLKIWKSADSRGTFGNLKEQWEAIKDDLLGEFGASRILQRHSYPARGLILPTRLGNVIRSFEYYSDREYGIDSIEIWPRLVAIIPKEYALAVDDAKTSFDFMMNCSALSLLLAGLVMVASLVYPDQFLARPALPYSLLKIAAFGSLFFFFYKLSISRADAWGSMVKGAFDLYRWELLKKLGYQQEPERREEERAIWGEISRQMIYGDRPEKTFQPYGKTPAPTYPTVVSTPGKVRLGLTRGIKMKPASAIITVWLRIDNNDPSLAEADVTVIDKLTDDYEYQWGSAKIDGVAVLVTGTNPYAFRIGHLLKTTNSLLKYKAIPRVRCRP
jgi:hypothetical protein